MELHTAEVLASTLKALGIDITVTDQGRIALILPGSAPAKLVEPDEPEESDEPEEPYVNPTTKKGKVYAMLRAPTTLSDISKSLGIGIIAARSLIGDLRHMHGIRVAFDRATNTYRLAK